MQAGSRSGTSRWRTGRRLPRRFNPLLAMTYEKRTCNDMVEDNRNDMWGMLVRKHRRMSSNDMMGTDLQLHEGNIHEMTWLGHTGKEAMVAELSFR